MAGTDSLDVGAPHTGAPVRPPRRVLPPDPATAPDDDGWPPLGAPGLSAGRRRRVEPILWLLVAAVAVAGTVIIATMLVSGPGSEAVLPPDGTAAGAPLAATAGPGAGGPAAAPPIPSGAVTAPEVPGHFAGDPLGVVDDGLGSGSDARDDPLDGDGAAGGVPDGGAHSERASPASTANDQVPSGWSEVARGFGLAFTRTGVGREAWFGTMSSWLTPEQAAEYRDVSVEAIPGGRLLRADVSEPGATAHTRGTLTYDTGMVLRVGLSYRAAAGSWLVARVELADTTGMG